MFRRKSNKKETKPEFFPKKIKELVRLPPEYRSKYEPTLLERRLLETYTLEEMDNLFKRVVSLMWNTGASTVSFSIEYVFGVPSWDKQNDEIVLSLLENKRDIPESELSNFNWSRDAKFASIKANIQNLAHFIKDLKRVQPLLKDDSLFMR